MAWLWMSCLLLPALVGSVAANLAPEFLPNMTWVSLPEDLPVGASVFWMAARDPENDTLTYGISGFYSYFFNVIKNTGEVILASSLDYETYQDFSINIFVSDSHNSPSTKTMLVIVEDRNDNSPVFQNTNFFVTVNETLPPDSEVFSVEAKDKDTGLAGTVRYFIKGVIPDTEDSRYLFKIFSNGSIILNGSLDYNHKSSFYQLELEACDSGSIYNISQVLCSQPVFLSISVKDQPDLDPQFVREFYSASVSEDASMGTPVLKVQAMDNDRGINDKIIYSISNSTRPGWFDIGSDGVIKVNGSLDREQLLEEDEEVQVQVTATEENLNIHLEKAKVSIWVTLRVTDVNDNEPEFYNCSLPACTFTPQEALLNFTGYVDEDAFTRSPIDNLHMVAYDPDKGNNGTFQLFLTGLDAKAFSVSPEKVVGAADVQVLVKAPELMDYEEQKEMLVQVVACDSDGKNTSVASVVIYLRDSNDNRPLFQYSQYNLSVFEHSPNGTVVSNSIHATDPDTGAGGQITYSLLPGIGADIFAVANDSGNLAVSNSKLLDREKQPVYYLTMQAKDGGGLASTTLLEIIVLDINDNEPQISGSYNIFVKEVSDNFSITIQAYDADQPGTNNSHLQFTLFGPYSYNFSVDPIKGILTNVGPLDREAIDPALGGRIVLTVNVSDRGVPALSSLTNVTITVEDINDNLPIFNQSSYSFSVKEMAAGVVVGVVVASDADQTEANNRISFSLLGVGANNFVIQGQIPKGSWQTEGQLQLLSGVSLDYETKNFYNLTVVAENPDPKGEKATANVLVTVQDVNDEPPTLDPASLQGIRVAENGSQHGQVTKVVAVDVDTMADLVIELVNTTCTKDGVSVGSLCRDWFSVLANGSVFINQSEAIDYETCDLVTLIVRAYDRSTDCTNSCFPAYSSNEKLSIYIEDVNDNAPYFLPEDKTFVIIPELVIPNQEVAIVRAKDNDTGDNGAIEFSIHQMVFVSKDGTTTPFQGFWISTSLDADVFVGSIKLVTNLNATRQGTYQVTVQAQNKPVNPPQEAKITLNLFTVDESYRLRLQFSMNKEEVGLKSPDISMILAQVTKTTVYIVNIQDMGTTARARGRSYMDAYFVFPNGTALTLDELVVLIRSDQDSLTQLLQLGLVVVGSEERHESNLPKVLSSVIIGLGMALLLVIVIMAVSLMCVRKSYERKLRATKAAKEARNTVTGVLPSVSAIPGTNIYTTERANPMLNLATKDLGFESQSSSSDLDHVSLNSLDENSVDLDKDKQEFRREPLNSELEPELEPDAEPLSMVLSGRKAGVSKGEQKEAMSFTNAGMDTTDV